MGTSSLKDLIVIHTGNTIILLLVGVVLILMAHAGTHYFGKFWGEMSFFWAGGIFFGVARKLKPA